jgi:hypothetical protein
VPENGICKDSKNNIVTGLDTELSMCPTIQSDYHITSYLNVKKNCLFLTTISVTTALRKSGLVLCLFAIIAFFPNRAYYFFSEPYNKKDMEK